MVTLVPGSTVDTLASGPPVMPRAMIAFMAKARNWPVTIMSWSTPTRVPLMRFGAVSAR